MSTCLQGTVGGHQRGHSFSQGSNHKWSGAVDKETRRQRFAKRFDKDSELDLH
jgi:hypothetical protein